MPYVSSGYWVAGYAEGDQVDMQVSWLVFDVLASSLYLSQSSRLTNTSTIYTPAIVQNLTQTSRLTNTSSLFSASVAPGTVTLTQNTSYINSNSILSSTAIPGPVTLQQSQIYTNTSTLYNSNISLTAVQSSIFNNTSTIYAPALGQGVVQLSTITNTNSFYTSTVIPGTFTLAPSVYTNSPSYYSPIVNLSLSQNSLFNNINSVYFPALGQGILQIASLSNTNTFYTPQVSLVLPANRYDNTNTFYTSQVNIELLHNTTFNNTNTLYSAAMGQGIIQISSLTNNNTFYIPLVSLIVLPSTYTNTNNFYSALLKLYNDLSGYSPISTQVNSSGIAQPVYTTDTVQTNSTTVNTVTKNTKLGILYNNVADIATFSTDSISIDNFPITNVQNDLKHKLWRVPGNTVSFNMTWSVGQTLSAIIFPISNLNSSSIVRIRTYADEAGTSIISDTGNQQPVLSTQSSVGINTHAYSSNSIARIFISKVSNIKHCKVDITDSTPQGYIEISRVVCGDLWNPVYGTSYGLSSTFLSDSRHSRTEAGNIYTDRKNMYKSISFDLNYLTVEDRQSLLKLINVSGIRKPIFVSIFPNSDDPIKEEAYQIYGKVIDNPTLTNPMYNMYTTSLTLESV